MYACAQIVRILQQKENGPAVMGSRDWGLGLETVSRPRKCGLGLK